MDKVQRLFGPGKSPEDVFDDFKGRRAGILKALTTDFNKFFQGCDPARDQVCLFGYSDGSWELAPPTENVPTEVPEPMTAINIPRDAMPMKDWLKIVAMNSDSWLLSLSFFLGTRCEFDGISREKLFNMINELPTILEVVSKAPKENKSSSGSSTVTEAAPEASNETKVPGALPLTPKKEQDVKDMYNREETKKEEENGGEMHQRSNACRVCEEIVGTGVDFGIPCATCKFLYHGKCVDVTPFKAMFITHYECPQCYNKRTTAGNEIIKVKKEEDVKDMDISGGAKEEKESEVKMREGSDRCRVCREIGGVTGVNFGVFCATCKGLYHGKCVKITPFDAMFIRDYECTQCYNKRTNACLP